MISNVKEDSNLSTSWIRHELKHILKKESELQEAKKEFKSKRILNVIKAMLVSNGLTLLIQLSMVPLMIYALGGEVYGEWLILYTIPSYIILSDFGLITTANTKIDLLCSKKKFLYANKVYFNSNILLFILIFLITIFLFLIVLFLGSYYYSNFNVFLPNEILIIITILMLDSYISLLLNHNSALYRTLKKFNTTVNWQSAGRVIPLLFFLIFILVTHDVLYSSVIMLLVRLIIFLLMCKNLNNSIFWIDRRFFLKSNKELLNLFRVAKSYMLIPLSNMIYLQGTIVAIAFIFNPLVVALYSTLRTYTRLMPQFIGIIGRSRWSEISYCYARKEVNEILKMRNKVFLQTISLSIAMSLFYCLIGDEIYKIWIGSSLEFDKILLILLVFNSLFISWCYSLEVFVLAINKVHFYSFLFFVSNILQLAMGIIFSKEIGVYAFPLMSTILTFFIFLCLLILIKKSYRETSLL